MQQYKDNALLLSIATMGTRKRHNVTLHVHVCLVCIENGSQRRRNRSQRHRNCSQRPLNLNQRHLTAVRDT